VVGGGGARKGSKKSTVVGRRQYSNLGIIQRDEKGNLGGCGHRKQGDLYLN